jgi:hypothetical protein
MIVDVNLPEAKPYIPTTRDVVDFFGNCGLVGESENAILLTLAAINKIPAGVESVSGSGKTVLLDIEMLLLPEDKVYRLGLTSNTATMYDFQAVNDSEIIYVEELQKAMNANNPIMIEILKNVTEGKSITRKVYDAVSKKNNNFEIDGDKGFLYSLALENKTKKDDEMDRRVINFMTDISQMQNRKVVKYIGKTRFNKSRLKIQEESTAKLLREHVATVLSLSKEGVENPFAEFITGMVPVPFVKVRSHIKHYLDLIEGSAKFYFKERLKVKNGYLATMQDIYTIHSLYGKTFNRKVHNLPQLGTEIMQIFDTDTKGWIKNEEKAQQTLFQDEEDGRIHFATTQIHKYLKGEGILLKHTTVQQQCDDLVEAGFLGKEQLGKKTIFYKTDNVEEFEERFDFTECFKAGYENMKKEYPEMAEEWYQSQLDADGRLKLFHPISDEAYSMEVIE